MDSEQDQQDLEQDDIISQELSKLYDLLIAPEEADDDEAFEEASDIIESSLADLEDAGQIEAMPEIEAKEEDKQAWLKKYIPIIEKDILARLEMNDDGSEE